MPDCACQENGAAQDMLGRAHSKSQTKSATQRPMPKAKRPTAATRKSAAADAADRLRARYGDPQPDDLRRILAQRPDLPPAPGDELPDELKAVFGRD